MTAAPLPAYHANRPLCPHCRQPITTDLAHHAGTCPVLYMALDADAWPVERQTEGHGRGGCYTKREPGCLDCGALPIAYRGRCQRCAAAESRRARAKRREARRR